MFDDASNSSARSVGLVREPGNVCRERAVLVGLIEDRPQGFIDDHCLGEVGRFFAAFSFDPFTAKPFVLLTASRRVHRGVHPAQFFHHRIESILHLCFLFRELRVVN